MQSSGKLSICFDVERGCKAGGEVGAVSTTKHSHKSMDKHGGWAWGVIVPKTQLLSCFCL